MTPPADGVTRFLLKILNNPGNVIKYHDLSRREAGSPRVKNARETVKRKKENKMQGSKLYVGNLKYSVTEGEVEELFSPYGQVKQVNIIGDKGFGFVEMSSSTEAEKAQEALNGTDFQGRSLRVNEANPPKNRERSDFRSY